MATGASTADLAVVLVDARKGLLTQSRRHSYICALLGIRSVVLAVNKIDLVAWSEQVFDRIVAEYLDFVRPLNFGSVTPIPMSARYGDNIASRSERTPWYDGRSLLDHLETAEVAQTAARLPLRFPVQWVNRPNLDFRGYAGTLASGRVAVGDNVVVASSGKVSRVERIVTFNGDRDSATAGDAVTLTLADEIDIGRGDVLVPPQSRPEVADQFAAHLLWMNEEPLLPGRSYLLRIGTKTLPAQVTMLKHKIDINTLEQRPGRTLGLNEIGFCNLSTASPVAFDAYADNRRTGAFILVDRFTHATAGAGMIAFGLRRATNIHRHSHLVDKTARAALKHQMPCVLWFTGLSGSGKSTIANLVEKALHERGIHTMMLDGDNIRHGVNRDLGFTEVDRVENIRRVGETAKLFVEAGLVVLSCFISPFRAERDMVRELLAPDEFAEIFVDVPLEECIRRDPKGLYAKALAGEITNFTGIDSPYESPRRLISTSREWRRHRKWPLRASSIGSLPGRGDNPRRCSSQWQASSHYHEIHKPSPQSLLSWGQNSAPPRNYANHLAQVRKHALGGFQICRVPALHELLKHRLQKRPAVLASSLIGKQSCQIDRGAQLPCPRALTSAQFERLHKALFGIFNAGPRH